MATQSFWSIHGAGLDPQMDPLDRDDDEPEAEWEEPSYKDMVLWCIDGGDSMHEVNPETGRIFLDQAIDAALRMYDHKMVTSPGDYVGVMIFGTGKTDILGGHNARFNPHCVLYIPLAQVGIRNRMVLKTDLAEGRADPEFWRNKFGRLQTRKPFPPSFAIQNAHWLFRHAGKAGTKRVFWATNNDNPQPTDTIAQLRTALNCIRDAKRVGIEFTELLMRPRSGRFHMDRFYGDLFNSYDDEYPDDDPDAKMERKLRSETGLKYRSEAGPQWDWSVATAQFYREAELQETPKRTVFSVPFHLGEGFTVGIKGYILTHAAQSARNGWFYNDEDGVPHEMTVVSQSVDFETGHTLSRKDIVRAFAFQGNPGQSQTRVQPPEAAVIRARTMGLQPSLKLIGTLPRNWLKPHHQITNPYFLYPNDLEYVGSRTAFAAFRASLVKRDQLAIGLLMPKRNHAPYFVALLPVEEKYDTKGDQIQAAGLVAIRLPFSEDLRDPPVVNPLTATEKEVEAGKMLVQRYIPKMPYDPIEYSNPALAMHFAVLQRAAYNETEKDIPNPMDQTVPKYYEIEQRASNEIVHFNNLIADDERSTLFLASEPATIEVDEDRVLNIWRHRYLHTLKVDELKAICSKLDIKPGNKKKAELIIAVHNGIMAAYPEKVAQWEIEPMMVV